LGTSYERLSHVPDGFDPADQSRMYGGGCPRFILCLPIAQGSPVDSGTRGVEGTSLVFTIEIDVWLFVKKNLSGAQNSRANIEMQKFDSPQEFGNTLHPGIVCATVPGV
jgi:hypothetical protein